MFAVDKDLVSKPTNEVEEAEPRQRHQLTHARPPVFLRDSRTSCRRQLLPARSHRRRSVPRRSPLPLRRTERYRDGPAGPHRSGVVYCWTERLCVSPGYALPPLSTLHAANILRLTDWL